MAISNCATCITSSSSKPQHYSRAVLEKSLEKAGIRLAKNENEIRDLRQENNDLRMENAELRAQTNESCGNRLDVTSEA